MNAPINLAEKRRIAERRIADLRAARGRSVLDGSKFNPADLQAAQPVGWASDGLPPRRERR